MILDTLIESARHEHSRKVAKISEMLAGYVGYSKDEAALIGQAALFHDAGKCDIPQKILNKPGPLTAREFSVIKTHTGRGSDRIKEALRVFAAARLIAEDHHEKLDGTGYQRFAAAEIHPYARLVAVADALDALLSKRAYKDSLSMDETLGYIKSGAGTHFDEDIVTALIAHADEIMTLYTQCLTYKEDLLMLKTKALFIRKNRYFEPEECVIEKVITLGGEEYEHFSGHLHHEYDFIRDNIDHMYFDATDRIQHCLLVLGEGREDGIVIQSDGTEYARNAAFMPYVASFLAVHNSGNPIS